jgi:hypothetical protein
MKKEKYYYSIEGKLYVLTVKQVRKLERLYPLSFALINDNHEAKLLWIEKNGKFLGTCENLAY